MLVNLHVKNLALIEEADVSFTKGLNILSGETGAGKSILIGSINTALGAKATKDLIRADKDSALIELIFQVDTKEILEKLAECDIEPEDGQIVISRKISENKNICRINGETVPVSKLREITGFLIDIHGQHEHQSLLKKSKHLEILDEFAKSRILAVKNSISEKYNSYSNLKNEYASMNLDEEAQRRELAFLEYEIGEIENARLLPNEEEDLMQDFKKMSNGKHIVNTLSDIYGCVGYENPAGAGENVEKAVKLLVQIADFDPELEPLKNQIMDLEAMLGDFCSGVRDYMENVQFDEETLEAVRSRLDLIHDLKRKYGNSIEQIMRHLKEAKEKREALLSYDARREALGEQVRQLKKELQQLCGQLTKLREAAAKHLEQEIVKALSELHFLDVQFLIQFAQLEHMTANGMDDVEFLISTNPGEKPRPLAQVASGGELSRIMLAVKTVLASLDSIDTLIFDEIDAGISGRTAACVAEKLHEIGNFRQVICISHLPQIVAKADTHFLIEKHTDGAATTTDISRLDEESSVYELARLLGGATITETTLQSARELKKMAFENK